MMEQLVREWSSGGGGSSIALVVQQMQMGKPSDAHGETIPHFPMS